VLVAAESADWWADHPVGMLASDNAFDFNCPVLMADADTVVPIKTTAKARAMKIVFIGQVSPLQLTANSLVETMLPVSAQDGLLGTNASIESLDKIRRSQAPVTATVGKMGGDADLGLAKTFSEIARILIAEDDPQATSQRIVSLAVATIENCEHAGISVIKGKAVTSPASSDEIPAIVDRIQSETGEGPCVDAIREHKVFQTGRLSEERRRPPY
jgi:hypothetical protein